MVRFKEEDAIDPKDANNDKLEDTAPSLTASTPVQTKFIHDEANQDPSEKLEYPQEDENTKLGKEIYASALKTLKSSTHKKANGWAQMNKAAEIGNTDAKVKIAFAKLLGNDYFYQDLEEAKKSFEKATNEEGHPEAQFGLGFLYATATMTNSSQATALLYYTFAAFGGNSWAQMALG